VIANLDGIGCQWTSRIGGIKMQRRIREAKLAGFAAVVLGFLTVGICWAQAPAPAFNTASAGVKAADIESAVAILCKPKAIIRSKDAHVSGCHTCPQGTDDAGGTQNNWEIYAQTPGHFTSPQDDNLILDGSGCDSHAKNFGGSYLFAIRDGKAHLLRYNPGLITDQCHKFGFEDGRNFLVCRGGWTGQGESIENVSVVSFDASGRGTQKFLLSTSDLSGSCSGDDAQIVRQSEITGIEFEPKDSEKITGMKVTANLGKVPCSKASSAAKRAKPAGNLKSYTVEFLFDGHLFQVAPGSADAMRHFPKNN
jgi:hypothetical protein